jgi:hypothetical protein
MYFVISKRTVYHILEDAETGRAPSTCGAQLKRSDLMCLQSGKPSRSLMKERPADRELCKHCRKAGA